MFYFIYWCSRRTFCRQKNIRTNMTSMQLHYSFECCCIFFYCYDTSIHRFNFYEDFWKIYFAKLWPTCVMFSSRSLSISLSFAFFINIFSFNSFLQLSLPVKIQDYYLLIQNMYTLNSESPPESDSFRSYWDCEVGIPRR